MSRISNIVIVGGGLAGATAAFALRERGFDGSVTLVSAEAEWPYERPPLSKSYLRGEEPIDKAYVRPAADYEANAIRLLRSTSATAIDPAARRIQTTAGELNYDALLIATGATPRKLGDLGVAGASLDGIHYLRTPADADAIRSAAATANDIVVIGGGWIGSEVTASLTQLGHKVTVVMLQSEPLEHILGTQVARVYGDVHREHGVSFMTGAVTEILGNGRVSGVRLADGQQVAADLVVAGLGVKLSSELAVDSGATADRGAIVVDEHLRTSLPDVYAIGDVVAAHNPRYGRAIHVEHWDNAIQQAKAVAGNLLGDEAAYDRAPYFYSDQYDLGMEYRGLGSPADEVVVRGDLAARTFHAFWLRNGLVTAAMNVNLWDDGESLQALVDSGAQVDAARLADPQRPLAAAA